MSLPLPCTLVTDGRGIALQVEAREGGACDSRLIFTHAKSRLGMIYLYFICAGRHSKRTGCERKPMVVPDIEAAVEDYYRSTQIPEHIATALRTLVTDEFDLLHAAVT